MEGNGQVRTSMSFLGLWMVKLNLVMMMMMMMNGKNQLFVNVSKT